MEFTHEENLKFIKERREMLIELRKASLTLGNGGKTENSIIAICDSMINAIDNHINEAIHDEVISYELYATILLAMEYMLLPLLLKKRDELIKVLFNII